MASTSKVMFILMIFRVMYLKETQATKHNVGGSQGWDASTDFSSWTLAQTFKVGDQLVFKYSSGMHSVVELAGKPAYENCDISTALDSKSSGEDVIKLTKAGTRYFACGTLGHCSGGMKVKINVVAATSSSTTDTSSDESPSASSSSSSSDTSSTSSTSSASHLHVHCSLLVVLILAYFSISLNNA